MNIRVQVIKVYDVETDGGDTTDPQSVGSHISYVMRMQSTEIEQVGKLVVAELESPEVVGPDDNESLTREGSL